MSLNSSGGFQTFKNVPQTLLRYHRRCIITDDILQGNILNSQITFTGSRSASDYVTLPNLTLLSHVRLALAFSDSFSKTLETSCAGPNRFGVEWVTGRFLFFFPSDWYGANAYFSGILPIEKITITIKIQLGKIDCWFTWCTHGHL